MVEGDVDEDEFWGAIELLAHPIRREIMRTLASGNAASITDLTRDLGKAWTTVAYHLDILEDSGLLTPTYERIPHSWGHVYRVKTTKRDELLRRIERGIEEGLLQSPKK